MHRASVLIFIITWSMISHFPSVIKGQEGAGIGGGKGGQKLSINLNQHRQKLEQKEAKEEKERGLFMSDASSHSSSFLPQSSSSSPSQSSSTWIKSGSERNYHQNPVANHSSNGIELIVQTNGKPSVVLTSGARNSGFSDTRHSHHGSFGSGKSLEMGSRIIKGKEGDSLMIECSLKESNFQHADHRISFEWFKGSEPVIFGPRVKLITRNKLKITSLQRSDRGSYHVIVRRETGSSESFFFQINLEEEGPEFREIFHGRSLYPGSTLNLKCSSRGTPLPQLRWYRYDVLLDHDPLSSIHHRIRDGGAGGASGYRIADYVDEEGSIISHLNVSSIAVEDGGLYSCEAVNEISTKKHTAMIQVFGPPMIHSMGNKSVVSSGKFQLDCPVSGFPIQEIHWKKDRKDVPSSKRIRTFPNGTIIIIDVHLEDEGWFVCEVKNKEGRLASGSFYLDVVEKPVINPFIFGPDLREGMRTTVVCSILSGELPISITWYKDGQMLQQIHPEAETVRLGDFTSSLKISNIERRHSGNYTCRAFHSNFPHIYSTYTAHMTVLASPKWVIKPRTSYTVLRRRNLVIDCQAEGIPAPTHQWKKQSKRMDLLNLDGSSTSGIVPDESDANDQLLQQVSGGGELDTSSGNSMQNDLVPIVSGPHIHVLENGSLVIIDANKSDEGEFICEANNGVGAPISIPTQVKVRTPVHFLQNFEIVRAKKGEKINLSCDIRGDDPIQVTWSKDRKPVKSPEYFQEDNISKETLSSRIFIQSADVSDTAFFTCSASNLYGSDEKNIQVIIEGPPEAPINLKAREVSSSSFQLTWSPTSDSNSPLVAYLIQYTLENETWATARSIVAEKDLTMIKVSGLEPNTSYRFRIISQNMFGKSRPSQELLITTEGEAPTLAPTNLRIEVLSSRSIRIRWQMIPSSLQFVEGFYIGYRLLDDAPTKKSYSFKTIDITKEIFKKPDFEAVVNDLNRNSRYNIIIQAFNKYGPGPSSDDVMAQTSEYDIPESIEVDVATVNHHSLSISWKGSKLKGRKDGTYEENDPSITGYIIKYRNNLDNWEEVKITGRKSSFLLENLRCGSNYQITVAPFNKIGEADPSPLVTAATAGSVPSAPSFESLVSSNSTHASLHLSAWSDNGCPILHFVVQYKEHFQPDWIMLSNNIIPEQLKVFISDLVPSTWYDLSMTAHSEAGQSEGHYLFSTLTPAGGTISPLTTTSDATWASALHDSIIVVPLICACFVIIVVFAKIGYFMIMANSQVDSNDHNGDHYSTIGTRKMESLSMPSLGAKIVDTGDCQEHLNLSGPEKSKIYEMVRRDAGNNEFASYYSTPFGSSYQRRCLRSSEDQNPGRRRENNHLNHQEIILERHLQPNYPSESYPVDVTGHVHKDQSGCCELNLNGEYQVLFTSQNRANVIPEADDCR